MDIEKTNKHLLDNFLSISAIDTSQAKTYMRQWAIENPNPHTSWDKNASSLLNQLYKEFLSRRAEEKRRVLQGYATGFALKTAQGYRLIEETEPLKIHPETYDEVFLLPIVLEKNSKPEFQWAGLKKGDKYGYLHFNDYDIYPNTSQPIQYAGLSFEPQAYFYEITFWTADKFFQSPFCVLKTNGRKWRYDFIKAKGFRGGKAVGRWKAWKP